MGSGTASVKLTEQLIFIFFIGFTALFWAIAAECEESVQSLIDQGSDLNIQNFDVRYHKSVTTKTFSLPKNQFTLKF